MEFLYAASHLAGDCPNPTNALGASDGSWAGPTSNNTPWSSRWAIADPVDPLTPSSLQTFRVLARKTAHSSDPTITVELWQGGTPLATLVSGQTISSTIGTTVTASVAASQITDPSAIEVVVAGASGGGNPNSRASVQIDSIEWEADTTVQAESHEGGSASTISVSVAGGGAKSVDEGSGSSTVITSAGSGSKHIDGGAEASVTVTTTGGGAVGSDAREGGATASVTISAQGSGAKHVEDGSADSLTVTATGAGVKSSESGSSASVVVGASALGEKATGGGSDAALSLSTTGGGAKHADDGSSSNVVVTASGGGENPEGDPTGGSQADVVVFATGGGQPDRAGGSDAPLEVTAGGDGLKASGGGSEGLVTISSTGGGDVDPPILVLLSAEPFSLPASYATCGEDIGTLAGCRAHYDAGEVYCDSCQASWLAARGKLLSLSPKAWLRDPTPRDETGPLPPPRRRF